MNLVPIDQAKISQKALQRMQAGRGLNQNFSDGIRDAFPILSIRGKVFRIRINGEEKALMDKATTQPVPFLDVVLVNAAAQLSKAYYAKGYNPDETNNPPDCWSLDSVKPDPSVANKMSVMCQGCKMNEFGSKITDNGKAAKACQDARRVAVVLPHQLGEDQQMMLLLRIPQSSLKNLKEYANLLARHMIEPGACITRLAFDYQVPFPKLVFNFVAPLPDDQYDVVVELAEADNTKMMLQAPDFDTAQSVGPLPNASGSMQGLPLQAPPVLEDAPQIKPEETMRMTLPVAAKPEPAKPLPGKIIDLPDGRKFDTETGEFIEPAPVVEDTSHLVTLPDGKVYNLKTGMYVDVTSPVSQPEPAKRTRAKKEKPATEPVVQQQATAESKDEADEYVEEEQVVSQQSNSGVKPASQALEDLLSRIVPKRP